MVCDSCVRQRSVEGTGLVLWESRETRLATAVQHGEGEGRVMCTMGRLAGQACICGLRDV